jgi:hypothetical protein
MSIERVILEPPVPVRNPAEVKEKVFDAIELRQAVWEVLPEGEHVIVLPVDNTNHDLTLNVTSLGTGVLRGIPRNGFAKVIDLIGGTVKPGGRFFDLNIPGVFCPISTPEIGPKGVPTGRELVHVAFQYKEGKPTPNT